MVEMRRYPTRLHLRCAGCDHQGTASLYLDQARRLKCSRCGSRQIVIVERDRTQSWARRRRGSGGSKNWRTG